jgi:hypothetical protein
MDSRSHRQKYRGYFVFSQSSSKGMDLESVKVGSHQDQEVVEVRAQEGLLEEEVW